MAAKVQPHIYLLFVEKKIYDVEFKLFNVQC